MLSLAFEFFSLFSSIFLYKPSVYQGNGEVISSTYRSNVSYSAYSKEMFRHSFEIIRQPQDTSTKRETILVWATPRKYAKQDNRKYVNKKRLKQLPQADFIKINGG